MYESALVNDTPKQSGRRTMKGQYQWEITRKNVRELLQ